MIAIEVCTMLKAREVEVKPLAAQYAVLYGTRDFDLRIAWFILLLEAQQFFNQLKSNNTTMWCKLLETRALEYWDKDNT